MDIGERRDRSKKKRMIASVYKAASHQARTNQHTIGYRATSAAICHRLQETERSEAKYMINL
jgi:hypothetical protein